MQKPLKILIEASGCLTSSYMIQAIKQAGHIVCGSDIDEFNSAFALCDDFILMPRTDDPLLWEKTTALLQEHQIDVVIPTLDESLLGWSERKEIFAKLNIRILISPPHTIATFLDKWQTYTFFKSINIPTPKSALFQHYGLIKPRFGRGGSGIERDQRIFYATPNPSFSKHLSDSHAESLTGGGRDESLCPDACLYLTQEEITGEEYTIDCFFDAQGKPIYIIPRKRIGVREGKSTKGEVCYVKILETHIHTIASHIHFIGAVNLQAFITAQNEVFFIEVNPRLGGGSALSFAVSENWVDAMVRHFVYGQAIKPKPIRYGLKMARSYQEVYF